MITVHLHGILGEQFGHQYNLDVQSPIEAVHAICVNTKNQFKKYLYNEGRYKKYQIKIDDRTIGKDDLTDRLCKKDKTIHIIPYLEGSDEILQTIVGVVLIALDVIFFHTGYLTNLGIALTVGGVAQMLTPTPKIDDQGRGSTSFSNLDRPIRQGAPIPIAYGKILISPLPISVTLEHFDDN